MDVEGARAVANDLIVLRDDPLSLTAAQAIEGLTDRLEQLVALIERQSESLSESLAVCEQFRQLNDKLTADLERARRSQYGLGGPR